MKKFLVAAAVAAVIGAAGSASALTTFDDNVTPDTIYGSGNSNGSFTVDRANGIELGLRAKIPYSGVTNSNGDGSYFYTTAEIDTGGRNSWNFDWTVNSDYNGTSGYMLDGLTYLLEFDYDPSAGVSYSGFGSALGITTGDPITPTGFVPYYDHSIGTNATGNGAGVEGHLAVDPTATYATLLSNNNVLQNSWRGQWMNAGAPTAAFDPYAQGTYNIRLSAFDPAGGLFPLASTEIVVHINGGAAPVPEPASMALLGLGLAGMGLRYRKRKNA